MDPLGLIIGVPLMLAVFGFLLWKFWPRYKAVVPITRSEGGGFVLDGKRKLVVGDGKPL